MMSTFTVIFVQIFFLSYALEEFEKSISIQLFLYKGFKKKLNKVKKNKKKKKNTGNKKFPWIITYNKTNGSVPFIVIQTLHFISW